MMRRRTAIALLTLALGAAQGCGDESGAAGSAAGGNAGAAGADGSASDVLVEAPSDPSCEAIQPGGKGPVGACVIGAVCAGYAWVFCPDGYDPHFGAQWKCSCASGIWSCQHPTGALTFPDCTGHTTPDAGADADGGADTGAG